MSVGNRFRGILLASALRSANATFSIPARGFDWLCLRILITDYNSSPTLNPNLKTIWLSSGGSTSFAQGSTFAMSGGNPHDFLQWFGRASLAVAVAGELDGVKGRAPLPSDMEVVMTFGGTGDVTYSVEAVMGYAGP